MLSPPVLMGRFRLVGVVTPPRTLRRLHLSRSSCDNARITTSFFFTSIYGTSNPSLCPSKRHLFRRAFASTPSTSPIRSNQIAVWTIIGLNIAVFSVWTVAASGAQPSRSPTRTPQPSSNSDLQLLRRMLDDFTLSVDNLKQGRYYTLITSAFSHQGLVHLAFNMINLYTFGKILNLLPIGGLSFTALCLGSGVAGSTAWLYQQSASPPNIDRWRRKTDKRAVGASGMVMGAAAAATCMFPSMPMQMMFIPINVPLWVITATYFGVDAFYLNDGRSHVGHAAHLGGAVFGAVYYYVFLRRFGGILSMSRRVGMR